MDLSTEKPLAGYFESFDGLRALAVGLVVINHMVIPLPQSLEFLRSRGHLGVEIFFAISGFLVLRSLHVSAFKHRKSGRGTALKEFFVRRAARIVFPYYLTIGVVFFLSFFVASLKEKILSIFDILPSFFFYFYNYGKSFTEGDVPGVLNIMWSLSFEEQFYILLGILFCLGQKRVQAKLVSVCVLSLIARFYTTYFYDSLDFIRIQFETHLRLDAILFGCLLYLNRESCIRFLKKHATVKPLILAGVLIAFYYGDIAGKSDFEIACSFLLTSVFFTLLLLVLLSGQNGALSKFLSMRYLVSTGKISYEIYLVHQLVNAVLVKTGLQNRPVIYSVLLFGLSIALASLFYRYLSVPIQNRFRKACLPKVNPGTT